MAEFDEPPMSRISSVVAHAIPGVLAVAIVVRAVYLLGVTPLAWVDTATSFALLVAVFTLAYHMRSGGLCLRCIQDVPLDPETEVQRNRLLLKFEHRSLKQFFIIWFCAVAILTLGEQLDGVLHNLSKVPMDAFFFTLMWGAWVHHRLAPWCPWCRGWDGGGEEELVPDPDPAETKRG